MFDPSQVLEIFPPRQEGGHLFLSWLANPLAPGYSFQVYLDRKLTWNGVKAYCALPLQVEVVGFDVGVVGPGEALTDFSASLDPGPRRRTQLTWQGGSFESPTIAGFLVYGSAVPGGPVDYGNVLATVAAYPVGIRTDGFGLGGYGAGGYGSSASTYRWTSRSLEGGTWTWAVVPFDEAGNRGDPMIATDVIVAPPNQGPFFPDGSRLHYVVLHPGDAGYDPDSDPLPEVQLTWTPATP